MFRSINSLLFKNSNSLKYLYFNRRTLLTPVEHIESSDINIIPFFLVMSITAGFWGWESYQNLETLKNQVSSFEDSLQDCLKNNQSCEQIEDNLNSLFNKKKSNPSMLVRVNTKSSHQIELTKQHKPYHSLPLISNDETE